MKNVLDWIKRNKLTTGLILIILFMLFSNINANKSTYTTSYDSTVGNSVGTFDAASQNEMMMKQRSAAPVGQSIPPTQPRMVIQNSSLSLVVKNVNEVQKKIIDKATQIGGFMVEANLQNPQDAATANVTVRVPTNKLNEVLEFYRMLSVKVASENLQGYDVTEQYVDIDERMKTLQKTKAKFDEILDKATAVQDILTVQRELINLQTEIDSLTGQKEYLEQNVAMTRITIYLSTDELSLPYAPSDSWRPDVILKDAVRHLLRTFRDIGEGLIWTAVYSIVLIPIGIIAYYLYKRFSPNKPTETKPLNSKNTTIH